MTNARSTKVNPMPPARRSIGTRIQDSKAAVQSLIPRRKRRRSATTNEILSQQQASALSAASQRSQGRHHEARAIQTIQSTTNPISGAVAERATAHYLIGLATFFFVCDYDEDGALSENEMQVMMEILLDQKPSTTRRRRTRAVNNPEAIMDIVNDLDDDDRVLESFVELCGHELYADGVPLPPKDFLHRCKRLKVGFRRCDTNGDNVLSILELEIALQKLDLVVADEDLEQLVQILDTDGNGSIEWSEMVRAAWTNTHVGPAQNRNSVLLLDALADVPVAAIVHHLPRRLANQPSTTHVPPKKDTKDQRPSLLTRLALRSHLLWHQDRNDDRVGSAEETESLSHRKPGKSRVEGVGVRILTQISMHQVSAMKRVGHRHAPVVPMTTLLPIEARHPQKGPINVSEAKLRTRPTRVRRESTTLARTRLTRSMRRRVHRIEWIAIGVAALVGVLCGLLSMRIEFLFPFLGSYDELSGNATYYLYLIAINIVVSILEVNLMYLAAVVCAFRMTVATRLTLYPQDAEREFLTRAIARAALQVSHSTDMMFGIDPTKSSPRLSLFFPQLVFKSKRYILKFLIKLFIRRVLWRAAAKTVLNALVLPINAVLNAWTLRSVMHKCRVTILGPPCITAILEDFFTRASSKLLPYQRVDYLRVMGCAIVTKRCVHPNHEIIVGQLRRRWVNDKSWPVADGCSCLICPDEPCALHQLDDINRFLASLLLHNSRRNLVVELAANMNSDAGDLAEVVTVDHARNMLALLILALVIDGRLGLSERRLYMRACYASRTVSTWPSVRRLKDDFLNGNGLPLDSIYSIITRRAGSDVSQGPTRAFGTRAEDEKTPWMDVLLYMGDRISALLSI